MQQHQYGDDPRVIDTTRGVSFEQQGQVLYVLPVDTNTGPGWDIVDADGGLRGHCDKTLDDAIRFFLGQPQAAAA